MTNKTGAKTKPLFQYRPPEVWALDNLFRGVIYFRSPLGFNDPYDCRTPPVLDDLTDRQLDFLRRTNPELWNISAKDALRISKSDFVDAINKKLQNIHGDVVRECGIACFSKRNDDLLMWSHYAGGGRGFCLKFHNTDNRMSKDYDVDYSGAFPDTYDYVKGLAEGNEEEQYTQLLLTHKYNEWEYEQEVRMIEGRIGEKSYPAEMLKAVYLGTAVSDSIKAFFCSVIRQKYPQVAIMEGKYDSAKCRVKFDNMR